MLGLNTKKTIDENKENFIATKHFDDKALKELVDYMLIVDSVVTRLILTDGSLSKDGIDYLIEKYGHKLEELDISENGLKDCDIESLIRLTTDSKLKVLCINNNFLSAAIVNTLKERGFEYLEADDQEFIEESLSLIHI